MKTLSIHFRITEDIKKRIESGARFEKKSFSAFTTEWITMLPELDEFNFFGCIKFLADKNNIPYKDVMRRAVEREARQQGYSPE